MMEYIHKRKYIEFGKTITIEVNIQANVLLMEDDDFIDSVQTGGIIIMADSQDLLHIESMSLIAVIGT